MALVCSRCGKKCENAMEVVTHPCPREVMTFEDIQDLVKMIDETIQQLNDNMNKRFAGAAETIRQLGGVIDEQQIQINSLLVRLDALEGKKS